MGEASSDDGIHDPENRLILAIVRCLEHPDRFIHGAGFNFARLISVSRNAFSISRNPFRVSRNQFAISRHRGAVLAAFERWSPWPDDTENILKI